MFLTYNLLEFSKALKEIRQACNLTQKEVSRRAKIHEDTLRKVENGLVIPKYETLILLSAIYKVDLIALLVDYTSNKDLLSFVDRLNEAILNNCIEEISYIINDLDNFLENNKDLHLFHTEDINRFKLYLKSIQEYYTFSNNGYLSAKENLIGALSTNDRIFIIDSLSDYPLDYFDISLLLLLSIVLSELKDLKESNIIMHFCIKRLSVLNYKSDTKNKMLLKLMYNLSYNYHIEDNHEDVLKITTTAINLALEKHTLFHLPQLFYRKGIAEYQLGLQSYLDNLKKSILLLDIYGMSDLKNLYMGITYDKYGINIF